MLRIIVAVTALSLAGCSTSSMTAAERRELKAEIARCGANGTVDMDPSPAHPKGEAHCG